MIEPTDEMATAWEVAAEPLSMDIQGVSWEAVLAGLKAAFALIDPVPDEVRTIYANSEEDEFYRVCKGGNVWRHECGCCYSTYAEIVEEYGEVTWEKQ